MKAKPHTECLTKAKRKQKKMCPLVFDQSVCRGVRAKLYWRSDCGKLPLVTLVLGMAHRAKPVQAENVAPLETAHCFHQNNPQEHYRLVQCLVATMNFMHCS